MPHGLCDLLVEEEELMTLFEFRVLSDEEQIDRLYQDAVYIGKRKEGHLSVVLYQLDGFYVEVYYHKYRRLVYRLRGFTSTIPLDPYLEQINVEDLVRC
ncbi:MAG TPA: hypothetical protein VGB56_00570 [Flavisolibacter sp.]|jgi:hypothetical protein